MADTTKKRPSPLTFRVTNEERAVLEIAAAGMPLGAYIRSRLLKDPDPPRRTRGRFPVKDHKALAQIAALLGKSEIGRSLNELSEAASTGCLLVSPETEAALHEAADEVSRIRRMLMIALGVRE